MSFHRKNKLVLISCLVLIITGIVFMGLQLSNNDYLLAFYLKYISIVFNSCFCSLLVGAGYMLLQFDNNKKARAFLVAVSLLLTVISALTLAEYLFHFNVGIDGLFVPKRYSNPIIYPLAYGQMYPVTAVIYLCFGLALIGFSTKIRFVHILSQYFLHLVTVFCSILLIGFAYNGPSIVDLLTHTLNYMWLGGWLIILSIAASFRHPSLGLTSLFSGSLVGNKMARRLFLIIPVSILVFGLVKIKYLGFTLWQHDTAISLFVICILVAALLIIWRTANWLNKVDLMRIKAENELKVLNAELGKRVEERTTELSDLLEKYKESELKFRTLAEKSMVGVYISQNEKYLYVNPRFADIFGYEPQELIDRPDSAVDMLFGKEAREIIRANIQARYNGDVDSVHYQIPGIRRDGSRNELEIYGSIVTIDGQKIIIGTVLDITERKKTENELKISEQKYKLLFESNPMPLWIVAKDDMTVMAVNDAAAKLYGYRPEELWNMDIKQLRPVKYWDALSERYQTDIHEATDFGVVEHIKKDGTEFLVDIIAQDIMFEGRFARLSSTNDVTEKLKAEEGLKLSEQKYKMLFENNPSPLTMIAKDDLSFIAVNEEAASLYGYSKDELLRMSVKELIPDEDLQKLQERFGMDITGSTDFGTLGQIRRDRSIINVRIIAHDFIFEGRPVRLSMIIDVTERLKAEESLRESEARFRGAFENASIGVALVSLKGEWLQVNRTLCEMLGYNEDELLGLTFQQITHPDDLESDLEHLNKTIDGETDNYRVEKRYFQKDGGIVWANLNVALIRDQNKQPLYFLSVIENITEKIESQRKFQNLVEDSIVGVYILQNGKLAYVNPRIMEETGYDEEEIIGMSYERFIYGDDREFVMEIIDSREKGLIETVRYEARILKKDGQPLWYEIIGSTTTYMGATALIGTMINVSERKAVYEELIKSEANLRSIFDSTDVSYLLLDTSYNIIALNQQMKKIYMNGLGIMLSEGDDLIAHIRPHRRQIVKDLYDSVLYTKKPSGYETSFINNGIATHFAASVFPIIVEDEAIGICISTIDITERKNALEKLEAANDDLQKKTKELEYSNTELEQFAYVASHDLQEPLRMVTSFLSQLEKKYGDTLDEKGKKYIYFATDGAKRMRQLILDLLEFSRVGRTEDSLEVVDFNNLINEVLPLYRKNIEELNAKVQVEPLPTLTVYKTPVRQVFQNLVGNSLKYHQDGVAPVIRISSKETKNDFEFSVKDNGIGIDPEYFNQIFIIFKRLHNRDHYPGTGMGLAITKKIIENMGGRIWVDSREGEGAVFHFTIPKHVNR